MKNEKAEYSFNLVDEKWIPVRTLDGELLDISIKEALLHSHDFRAIEDGSPLVTISLYRFLLAVLHRALEGPADIKEAASWYKEGFPKKKIEAYLEKWYDHFDLFHPKHPFYQTPDIANPKFLDEWRRLSSADGKYNTNILFNDTRRADYVDFQTGTTSASIARLMIQHAAFALDGMIRRFAFRQINSPLVDMAILMTSGENLHETLSLNLVPYDHKSSDTPPWEREPFKRTFLEKNEAPQQNAKGIVQLYSWPARSFLIPMGQFQESKLVTRIYYASGIDFDAENTNAHDPMLSYRKDEKQGFRPLRLNNTKAFWRDFFSLFSSAAHGNAAPLVVEHTRKLLERTGNQKPVSVLVFGMIKSKAGQKIQDQRQESYRLPALLTNDEECYDLILRILQSADETQKALNKAVWNLSSNLLSQGERGPDKTDIEKLRNGFSHSLIYWPHMERAFHLLLSELKPGHDEDHLLKFWKQEQINAIQRAWASVELSAGDDAKALRAISKASRAISARIKELKGTESEGEDAA